MCAISDYEECERWLRWGLNDCEVSRLTGIPRETIRGWRRQGRPQGRYRQRGACPRCDGFPLDETAYAYLLGLYLGDGHIVRRERVFELRITVDRRHPGIIGECGEAMAALRPAARVAPAVTARPGCVNVTATWTHWPGVFPQHGPGPKHARPIVLEPWQQRVLAARPEQVLKGLIHSDGCRVQNRVNGRACPRYMFTNHSADIRAIFCRACDLYGVPWRQSRWQTISVARRAAVARLDAVIGPKR